MATPIFVSVIKLVSNKVLIKWRIWARSMLILWKASILKELWRQMTTNMLVSNPLPQYRILTIQDFCNDWDFAPVDKTDNEDYLYFFIYCMCNPKQNIRNGTFASIVHSLTEYSSNHKQVKIYVSFEFLAWTLKVNCVGHQKYQNDPEYSIDRLPF